MERIYAIILLLLCAGVPSEAYDLKVGSLYYNKVTANEVAVTSGDSEYIGFVDIPEQVNAEGKDWQVTAIADAAFYGCDEVYSITIPRTVTTIGNEAFVRCSHLNKFAVAADNSAFCSVDGVLMDKRQQQLISFPAGSNVRYAVPNGVQEIGRWAFTHCNRLSEVTLPASLMRIADAAFYGCSLLTAVSLPSQLREIGVWAFAECNQLREVTIPATVTTIGDGAFSFCASLQGIYVGGNSSYFSSVDGVLMNRQQTMVVAFPSARGGSYRLPATVDSIATQAFYGSASLQTIILPASMPSVAGGQFVFCDNLKEILVDQDNSRLVSRDGVLFSKDLGQLVFFPNAKGGDYAIPDGVTALSHGPFLGSTAITAIDIPLSVTAIDDWTFLGCHGLQTVNIPYQLTTLGTQAFSDCTSLQTIICNGMPVATSGFEEATQQGATLYVPQGSKAAYIGTEGWDKFAHIEEYGLYATDQQVERAREQRIPILITRTLPITAIETTVTLPQGISLGSSTGGTGEGLPIVLSQANQATHTLSCTALSSSPEGDGGKRYRLSIRPTAGQALADADTLAYITVAAQSDCPTGAYELKLSDISFTYHTANNHGEAVQSDNIAGLNVRLFVGDVNRNGRVNVADVVETIRYLSGDTPDDFHLDEADINANGTVNYYDTEEAVALIHNQSEASPMVVSDIWQTAEKSSDRLSSNSQSVEAGTNFMLDVQLTTTGTNLTAYQFKIVLPPKFSPLADQAGEVHCQLPARYQGDGRSVTLHPHQMGTGGASTCTVVSISTALSPLTTGMLVSIPVHTSHHTELATHQLLIKEILFADAEGNEYYLPDAMVNVTVTESMGVDDIMADDGSSRQPKAVYDIGGRKVSATPDRQRLNKGVYIVDGRVVVIK